MRGWYDNAFDRFLDLFRSQQRPAPAMEIGVFCGKSFIPIYHRRSPGFPVLAVDMWSPVDSPEWRSFGDKRAEFLKNARDRIVDHSDIVVVDKDSRSLTADDYLSMSGVPMRVIHIDGDHSMDGCLHDLVESEKCLSDDGVIILDDVFNTDWPGVGAATNEFLGHARKTEIRPILIGHGKVVLSKKVDWDLPEPLSRRQWHNGQCLIFKR